MSVFELGTLQAELGGSGTAAGIGFTLVTVTGSYSGQGTGVTGSVTFTPTQVMSNNGSVLVCSPLTVQLDQYGAFAVLLAANDDDGTIPVGTTYKVSEEITSAFSREYFIIVPSAQLSVDLSTLSPGNPGAL